MMIKNKVINSVAWSATERFSIQGIQFVLSFIIARQLSPSDYGLIAMLNIFVDLAQTFVDSGFSNALIHKQKRTDIDFSTVFYFNIVVGGVLYMFFALSASLISQFYNQPLLRDIIFCLGLNFVISSFATVQRAKLTINLDFRKQTLISLVAVTISGSVAIWMAYYGYGVWTLVVQSLLNNAINVFLLWFLARWKPLLIFSMTSFKELFNFGGKLLGGAILHTLYTNLYTLIIGKTFSATELGCFNRAFSTAQYPSSNITAILIRVIYPVECQYQDDNKRLQEIFYQFMRVAAYVIFPLMIILAALAKPLVQLVLTDKWIGSVPLIQIMCFAYMWDPIMRMNWILLNVKHRSDYALKSEIIKKIIAFTILFVTIPFGVNIMCAGLVLYALIDIVIITQFTKKLLPGVTFVKEIHVLLPILVMSIIAGSIAYIFQLLFENLYIQFFIGGGFGFISYIFCSLLLKREELKYFLYLKKHKNGNCMLSR